jgi:hypothetical protein
VDGGPRDLSLKNGGNPLKPFSSIKENNLTISYQRENNNRLIISTDNNK